LAQSAGDKLTVSYVVRHLGFAEMAAGRLVGARGLLEEAARLRREIGFAPGVAAGCSRWPNWLPEPVTVMGTGAAGRGHRHRGGRRRSGDPALGRAGPPRTMTSVPDRTVGGSCAQSWR